MIEAIKYAFSMYSVIPCKMMTDEQAEIGRKGMLFAFPLIGIVIGILQAIAFCICRLLGLSCLFAGAILTVIPVAFTGGIHMDGYMDVSDAMGSWGSIEKKRAILKDSHVGGAAVLHCVLYFILMYGSYCQLYLMGKNYVPYGLVQLCIIFVLERCLSAYMVMSQPKASQEGMAAQAARDARSGGRILLVMQGILPAVMLAVAAIFFPDYIGKTGFSMSGRILLRIALWVVANLFLVVGFFAGKWQGFRRMKALGGMSGDVAGYVLQVVELIMVFILSVIVTVF